MTPNAERQRLWRERHKQQANAERKIRKQHNGGYLDREQERLQHKNHAAWWGSHVLFLNVDGEADTTGQYDILGVHDGTTDYGLVTPGQNITFTLVCEHLRECRNRAEHSHPGYAIKFVAFSFGYDVDRWIGAETALTDSDKRAIAHQKSRSYGAVHTLGWQKEIEIPSLAMAVYAGKKIFRVRWLKTNRKGDILRDSKGVALTADTLEIWDVWSLTGFSFERTVDMLLDSLPSEERTHWLPLREIVREGKAARGTWQDWTTEQRVHYNNAELVLLNEFLHHVTQACMRLGISPRTLAGPADMARALLVKYGRGRHVQPEDYNSLDWQDSPFNQRIKQSYAGGRIECLVQGHIANMIEYDLTSAYPAALADAPCLAHGYWRELSAREAQTLPAYAILDITWVCDRKELIGPFPTRSKDAAIRYPLRGYGSYWTHEIQAALANPRVHVTVSGGQQWVSTCDEALPFAEMVHTSYQERKRLIDTHDSIGALVLKLALNSMYGIFCQTAGAQRIIDEDGATLAWKFPKYYNLALASYITSVTRAKLYSVAWPNQDILVEFSTDALHLTSEIPGLASKDKTLGSWEYCVIGEVLVIGSGIRFTREHGFKTRGWASKQTYETVERALLAGDKRLVEPSQRYVDIRMGLGTPEWGLFMPYERVIDLTPTTLHSKRYTHAPLRRMGYVLYKPYSDMAETCNHRYSRICDVVPVARTRKATNVDQYLRQITKIPSGYVP